MRRRQLVLAMVGWLAVVAVGSTLVWAVIARTGDKLVTSEPLAVATPSATQPTGGRAATVSPRPSPSATPPATPPATATQDPATQDPATEEPAPASRTWQGEEGLVTARCRGGVISLVAAQPDAGFAVEVADDGPARLEVAFNGREDSAGRGSRVTATCVSGVPSFNATPTGGDDGGDTGGGEGDG